MKFVEDKLGNVRTYTWEDVLESNTTRVFVLASGYVEHSIFGGHWEPFSKIRKIEFQISGNMLENRTFFLEEPEENQTFLKGKIDKEFYIYEADIWTRSI